MPTFEQAEYPEESTSTQFDFINIQDVLIKKLQQLYQEPLEFKNIYVLSAVNDVIEGQLEQQLRQEREDHDGKRIVLIKWGWDWLPKRQID